MMRLTAVGLALFGCFLAVPGQAQGFRLPDSVRVSLDNGVVLILSEKHEVPLIGVEARLRGGAVTDPDGLAGLSALLAGLLEQGAGDRDAAAFAETVAAAGGSLSAAAQLEAVAITGEFLARDRDLMISLLADMLLRPRLEVQEFEKLRGRAIDFLRAAKDSSLYSVMPLYGNAFLFGDHPYGRPVSGSEASLAAIGHDDVVRHYEQHFGADRLIISVSGEFDTDEMRERLTAAFGEWRPPAAALSAVEAPTRVSGRRVLLVDRPGLSQTYFWLGNIGVAVDYPQRAALDIVNTAFGGRFTSILNNALRVESGLTYGVRSGFSRHSEAGAFSIDSFTRTDQTARAVDMTLRLLGDLHQAGLGDDAIRSSRNYILGQFPPRYETALQLAGAFARLELHDLDRAYIEEYDAALAAVGSEQAADVIADAFPRPDDLAIVLIGDAESIRDVAESYGPVTEIAIAEPRLLPADPAPAQRSK